MKPKLINSQDKIYDIIYSFDRIVLPNKTGYFTVFVNLVCRDEGEDVLCRFYFALEVGIVSEPKS